MKRFIRNKRLLQVWLASLTLMFCAQICSAQQHIKIVETLPDGSFIVEVDGVQLRTIDSVKAREIQERKIKLESATAQLAIADEQILTLKHSLELALKDAKLATLQTELEHERAAKFEAMYASSESLRLEAEKLIGRRSRTTEFFDRPAVQWVVKLGIPFTVALINK